MVKLLKYNLNWEDRKNKSTVNNPLCVFVCMQRLLQHPELSNSQLLADFLSPHSIESQFLDKMLPDVNLGMYRFLI